VACVRLHVTTHDHACADVIGFGMSKMDLISFTVLFMSRETFRLVALRSSQGNLSWLRWAALPLGLFLSAGVASYHHYNGWGDLPGSQTCILLFLLGSIIELAAEPAFCAMQANLAFAQRVRVEGLSNLCRVLCTFVCIMWLDQGVVSFGLAQLLYSVLLFVGFWSWSWRQETAHSRRTCVAASSGELQLVAAFGMQTIFKYLLTEGDRLVLMTSSGLYEMGVYAVVTNYGKAPRVRALPHFMVRLVTRIDESSSLRMNSHCVSVADAGSSLVSMSLRA
jgi:oligosaccharide translocation protein RFT1